MSEELTHEDYKLVQLMQSLKRNEGWQYLVEELEGQLKMRRDQYELEEGGGLDALIAREFPRGEIAMLRLVLALPDTIEDSARAAIEAREAHEKEEEDE